MGLIQHAGGRFEEQLSETESAQRHLALFAGGEKALLNAGLVSRPKLFFSEVSARPSRRFEGSRRDSSPQKWF